MRNALQSSGVRIGVLLMMAGAVWVVSPSAATLLAEWKSGIAWKEPAIVDPGPAPLPAPVPSDAVVLFDGTGLDAWVRQGGDEAPNWSLHTDGTMAPKRGGIQTKESFGDVQLHVEWMTPVEEGRRGQDAGNSGVFLMGQFEVQVLNSYENRTYYDGQAGSLYKQSPPLVNASRAPGQWQSYDIIFEHPHFGEAGELLEPAYITVLHNGVLIQNRYALQGATMFDKAPAYQKTEEQGPIMLQDHSNPVRYRNIWVRRLELSDEARTE